MKSIIPLLVVACLLMAGCNSEITVEHIEGPPPKRFNIQSYSSVANENGTIEGLWVVTMSPKNEVFKNEAVILDTGLEFGNPDAFVETNITQSITGYTRIFCIITLDERQSFDGYVSYRSTCNPLSAYLFYDPEEHRILSSFTGIRIADLTEKDLQLMEGTMRDEITGQSMQVDMKRIGDMGTDIGDITLNVNGELMEVDFVHTFYETVGYVEITIPGINYQYQYPVELVQAYGEGGRFEIIPYRKLDGVDYVTKYDDTYHWVISELEVSYGEWLNFENDELDIWDARVGYETEVIHNAPAVKVNAGEDYSLDFSLDGSALHSVAASFSGFDKNTKTPFSGHISFSF